MRALWLLLLLLLVGCPSSASAPQAAEVRTGERYRFEQRAVAGAEQVLEVLEVSASEVRYRVRNRVAGEARGEALELSFPLPGPRLEAGEALVLKLAGRAITCRRHQHAGLRVDTAVNGDRVVFPGVVQVLDEGVVQLRLVAVEPASAAD